MNPQTVIPGTMRRLLPLLCLPALLHCGVEEFERPGGSGSVDVGTGLPGTDAATAPDGTDGGTDVFIPDAGLGSDTTNVEPPSDWMTLCAGCHGTVGQGGIGPALAGTTLSYEELRTDIDERMPPSDPSLCTGSCAEELARYILSLSGTVTPETCDVAALAPRRLRLLTPDEFNTSVNHVLGAELTRPSCSDIGECDWQRESCVSGGCVVPACGQVVFHWTPDGPGVRSVAVAGSFNDWTATGPGSFPMVWTESINAWRLVVDTGTGQHRYKFVINDGERWISDPLAVESEDDGFSGRNSIVRASCDGDAGSENTNWAQDLPAAVRPTEFFYDSHVAAARVTTVHLESYLAAAEQVGTRVARTPERFASCNSDTDRACLVEVLQNVASRAWRRPVGSDEAGGLADFGLRASAEFGGSPLEIAVTTVLSHREFLYRSELGEPVPDGRYRLTEREIAIAIAFMITGQPPDAALWESAEAGTLGEPDTRRAQAQRLLATAPARQRMRLFARQWLGIESLPLLTRSATLFPSFSAAIGRSMMEETERLFEHVVFESRGGLQELMTADYSFVDGALAAIYTLNGGGGQAFERRELNVEGQGRAGVLGHASILAATSHSDQTSPIRRGLFIRQRMLCQTFPIPPANAGGVPEVDPGATTRERFRQHTDDPTCADCHRYIDDLGFGFEQFDAIGQFRTTENGQTIEVGGNMNDVEGLGTGTDFTYTDLHALGTYLAESDALKDCFARQYAHFALGETSGRADACVSEVAVNTWQNDPSADILSLLEDLVASDAFIHRWEAP